MRLRAGLTLEEAASRLDMNRTSLNRIEFGQYKATVHLIRSMMDLYDEWVDDILDQARDALKPGWFQEFSLADSGYVDVETEAVQVHEFGGLNVPGLLQTEPYMRALFTESALPRTAKKLDDDVMVRLIRQQRLTDDEYPLDLVAIVDEAALRRQVGGREVMRDQLDHLVEAGEWPTVSLQVLPLGIGAHSAMTGAFTLLSFPADFNPEMLYVDHVGGSLHVEEAEQVRLARLAFDRLRTEALSPADSVTMLGTVRAGLDR
jgi:DNA-binding XRE family transcriptional regulator